MRIDNWDDLRFVLAMRRHGTMSAAARYLETNVATVSRRLDRLTQELATPLFEKRGQSFVPTEAADRLARLAEEFDQNLRAEIGNLAEPNRDARVLLEIAAPPAVHQHFLLPRTSELAAHLPHVLLNMTDKVYAQGLGEADIQVRLGRPEGGRLKARKFRDYVLRVYHGMGQPVPEEWIGLSHRYPDADMLRTVHPRAAAQPRYRVEEMPMAYEMARATGLAAMLPDFMVAPGDGLVAAELPGNAVPGEMWLVYHETRHADRTLRAVIDWFCAATPEEARRTGT
jgi:DNA-binding transcriptional LysR family regulator